MERSEKAGAGMGSRRRDSTRTSNALVLPGPSPPGHRSHNRTRTNRVLIGHPQVAVPVAPLGNSTSSSVNLDPEPARVPASSAVAGSSEIDIGVQLVERVRRHGFIEPARDLLVGSLLVVAGFLFKPP